jgi:hypothetical protein
MVESKKKMSLKRPGVDTEKARKAFVDEPEAKITKNQQETIYPWQQDGVSERVITPFNLRLPEPLKLKLEWIAKNSVEYRSMHDLCMKAVVQKLEEEFENMGIDLE